MSLEHIYAEDLYALALSGHTSKIECNTKGLELEGNFSDVQIFNAPTKREFAMYKDQELINLSSEMIDPLTFAK